MLISDNKLVLLFATILLLKWIPSYIQREIENRCKPDAITQEGNFIFLCLKLGHLVQNIVNAAVQV